MDSINRFSIHAPQWGATTVEMLYCRMFVISIHAPQWGATVCLFTRANLHQYFNPRTPVGCDPHDRVTASPPFFISIHAPQWGATIRKVKMLVLREFQSTHPSGVRLGPCPMWCRPRYFNPRTPVGCDTKPPTAPAALENFNPRTPVGCDCRNGRTGYAGLGFQSTPPSGVRRTGRGVAAC